MWPGHQAWPLPLFPTWWPWKCRRKCNGKGADGFVTPTLCARGRRCRCAGPCRGARRGHQSWDLVPGLGARGTEPGMGAPGTGPAPRLEQKGALEAQEGMGTRGQSWAVGDVSLAQDWPGTAGTHLGHPSPVPHGPAEDGEGTLGWPRPGLAWHCCRWQEQAGGPCWPWPRLCFAAPGCDGRAEPTPGRGKGVGMGKEGFVPVLAGAGSPRGPGATGQGEKGDSNSTRGEAGAAGGQCTPGFPEGPRSHQRGRGKEHTHHTHPASSSAPFQPHTSHGKHSVPPKSLKSQTGFTHREVLLRD